MEILLKIDKIMKRRNLISKTAICLYLVLALVLCVGCSDFEQQKRVDEVEEWQIVEYDSCEYVIGFRKMAHKGNCKYCTERALAN